MMAYPCKNRRTCDQTHQHSFFPYQEHFHKVSLKSDESNLSTVENGIFWDQKWPNLGLNDGHARARMREHMAKLFSINSFHSKNISTKFYGNLLNQNRYILENVHFAGRSAPKMAKRYQRTFYFIFSKYGFFAKNYITIRNIILGHFQSKLVLQIASKVQKSHF